MKKINRYVIRHYTGRYCQLDKVNGCNNFVEKKYATTFKDVAEAIDYCLAHNIYTWDVEIIAK